MTRKNLVLATLLLLSATTVNAGTQIIVGDHALLPNAADQTIQLYVTGDDQVRAFNLRSQIGDGSGSELEPVFTAVDFSGAIWGDNVTILGGPVPGAEQFAQASVAINSEFATVDANGLVATLQLSTVGLMNGVYELSLTSLEIGENSDFVLPGGQPIGPDIMNGTIRIVPEPNSLTLFIGAFSCLLFATRSKCPDSPMYFSVR